MENSLYLKVEESEINMYKSRLNAISEIPENPMGVEIQHYGSAKAFSAQNIPGPSFNTVKGISYHEISRIDEILEFYQHKSIPAQFEVTPFNSSQELFGELANRSFYQTSFHTSFYGAPIKQKFDHDIKIRELNGDEFDIFAKIYTESFVMPDFLVKPVAKNNQVLYDNSHWNFYIASIDGEPAGVGVSFIQDKIGTLAASATLPRYRNKGVHNALIQARFNDMVEADCEMVTAQAKFNSSSHRNFLRKGMNVAYTKSIFTKGVE